MTIMQVRAAAILCLASVSALRPVTVLGGNGYVGSRVAELLVKQGGLAVRSVSKSGTPPCSDAWTSEVEWVANDLTRGSREALEAAIGALETTLVNAGAADCAAERKLLAALEQHTLDGGKWTHRAETLLGMPPR